MVGTFAAEVRVKRSRPLASTAAALAIGLSCAPPQSPNAPPATSECKKWVGERGLARAAASAKDDRACVAHFAAASHDGQDCENDAISAASCQARLGHNKEALDLLERSIGLGFRERDRLEDAEDFEPLRHDPRWPSILRGADEQRALFERTLNPDLYAIYEDDQADRDPSKAAARMQLGGTIAERDQIRREHVRRVLEAGGAKTSADFYHAAIVYQHGETPEEIAVARDLALQALKFRPPHPRARWLVAAATDRILMYQGQPQRYATQYRTENGEWVLYAQDPTITDAERAEWDAPPLAIAQKTLERIRKEMGPPTPSP